MLEESALAKPANLGDAPWLIMVRSPGFSHGFKGRWDQAN
jgi:hypothetical protein